MPLVVPELVPGNKDEWTNKLVGKKISDSGASDVTVGFSVLSCFPWELIDFSISCMSYLTDVQTFAKKDLPEEHRILKPNDPTTADHKPNR